MSTSDKGIQRVEGRVDGLSLAVVIRLGEGMLAVGILVGTGQQHSARRIGTVRVLNRGHMCRLHGICLLAVSIRVIRGINGICGINAICIIRTTARSRPILQREWIVGQ